jgi:hypothetical protein
VLAAGTRVLPMDVPATVQMITVAAVAAMSRTAIVGIVRCTMLVTTTRRTVAVAAATVIAIAMKTCTVGVTVVPADSEVVAATNVLMRGTQSVMDSVGATTSLRAVVTAVGCRLRVEDMVQIVADTSQIVEGMAQTVAGTAQTVAGTAQTVAGTAQTVVGTA